MDEQNNYSYRYDPETGEPINTAQPTDTQPAEPQQPESPQEATPVYDYQYVQPQPVKQKKQMKLTRGGIALLIIGCILISAVFGVGGAMIGVNYLKSTGAAGGSTVIYQSVKDEALAEAGGKYSVAEVAEAVGNSVVEIVTEQITIDNSWIQNYVKSGAGSGVIISTDGYIITNNHVISGATQIKVTLHDGTEYKASVIGTDSDNDIAVIKINATGLTAAVWGDSDSLVVGQEIVAIGNPLGSLGGTVTNGIISALNRTVTVEKLTMELIQTNAAVNPGNSGGGLFDLEGHLIGIVNAKSTGESTEGIGFAIPQATALKAATNIIENGSVESTRPALGVTVIYIQNSTAAAKYGVSRLGVYVGKINSGSAAEKAGLKMGDYIMSIDGNVITSNSELSAYLDKCKIGQTVSMQIVRTEDNVEKMITVEVALQQYDSSDY